jgi:hypothetical protein
MIMGLIHTRASKKRDKAQAKEATQEAKLAKAQRKQAGGGSSRVPAGNSQWAPILVAIESGEASWDDLSRVQKLTMPLVWQMRCRAADRRNRTPADRPALAGKLPEKRE